MKHAFFIYRTSILLIAVLIVLILFFNQMASLCLSLLGFMMSCVRDSVNNYSKLAKNLLDKSNQLQDLIDDANVFSEQKCEEFFKIFLEFNNDLRLIAQCDNTIIHWLNDSKIYSENKYQDYQILMRLNCPKKFKELKNIKVTLNKIYKFRFI